MVLKYNKKNIVYYVVVIFAIFYSFFTSFESYLYGSKMMGAMLLLLVVAYGMAHYMYRTVLGANRIHMDASICWVIILIYSVFNNQDMKNGTETRWLLPMAGILIFYILKSSLCWRETFVRFTKAVVKIHAFFTIFFYIFKGLYLNYFVKILPGDHTYIISKFKAGSMPGITTHYSTNGIYLGLGFIFFAATVITDKKVRRSNRLRKDIFDMVFVLFALFLTTKRAHILFGVIAIIVVYYVYNSDKKLSRTFYITIGVIAGILLLIFLAQFLPVAANVVNRFLNGDSNGELTNGRVWFWKFALGRFVESPIFGIGWGGFKHRYFAVIGSYASTSKYVDCHNVFIQLLCEQGIIGLTLFILASFGTLFTTWKYLANARTKKISIDRNEQSFLALSLGIQVFFICYCTTGNCLYDCECFYTYIISCALAYSTIYKCKKERKINGKDSWNSDISPCN